MGRAYASTGITVNFGGTSIAENKNIEFTSGTYSGEIYFTGNQLVLFTTAGDQTILIAADDGTAHVSGAVVELTSAGAGVIRFQNGSGTIGELDANGNLLIAGTIGENKTF